MSSEFRTPPSGAAVAGTVTYRCADCGADLQPEDAVFVDPAWTGEQVMQAARGLIPMTEDVRTYHPEHVPLEVTSLGR